MTVRLRPHHLLCMLTYVGKGYSPTFTANYDAIARRLREGEPIEIVEGPDDVCAPLLDDPDAHCRNESVRIRDRLAARDVGRLIGSDVGPGATVRLNGEHLAAMRRAFRAGATREACAECEWHRLCDAVAAGDFAATRLSGTG